MNGHGFFSGNPKTEWLADSKGPDRDMQLLEDFSYTDPQGRLWLARKDAVINGASIPRPLWTAVGSPYTDDYRRASIVHDVACHDATVSRKEADTMFFHACRAGGCSLAQARVLYIGVRIGDWATKILPAKTLVKSNFLFRSSPELQTNIELKMLRLLSAMSKDATALEDEDSLEKIDEIIDRHLARQQPDILKSIK